MTNDNINHPMHYNRHESCIECIEIVRYLPYSLGNAIKYLWRAGLKSDNVLEDYKKALWYLQDFKINYKSILNIHPDFKNDLMKNLNKFIDNSSDSILKSLIIGLCSDIYQDKKFYRFIDADIENITKFLNEFEEKIE